jgi:hypothetical protein
VPDVQHSVRSAREPSDMISAELLP